MQLRQKGWMVSLLIIMALMVVSACSKGGSEGSASPSASASVSPSASASASPSESAAQAQFSTDPVTIKIGVPWGEDGGDWQNRVLKVIKEKLPHITVEYVKYNGTVEGLQELYANNVVPDILLAYSGQQPLIDLDMVYPLEEMVEKYGFDLNRFNQGLLAELRSRDAQGRLIGFPDSADLFGLYYNKEVFDLFGLPYPTADMNWDQILDLAAKMTTERGGIKYKGLEFSANDRGYEALVPLLQLSPAMTNPDTGEVLIDKDPVFTKYLEFMKKYYSIPGNYIKDLEERGKQNFGAKNVAMHVDWHGYLSWWGGATPEETQELQKNIDILPIPSWADLPNVGTIPMTHPWVINNLSEKKDAAFQVLITFASDDAQLNLVKNGTPTALDNPELFAQFGAIDPRYTGKNVAALFERTPATPPTRKSFYDKYVSFDGSLAKFAESDMNIPEFLRVLKEESEAKIKEAMAQAKK